jgi:hypothetical protein
MSDSKKIIFEAKRTLQQAPADCSSQAPLPQVHVQGDLPYVRGTMFKGTALAHGSHSTG